MVTGVRRIETVGDELRLVLDNTLDAVEGGRGPLVDYAERRSVGPKALNRLEVVFEELVSNAIRHGFRPNSDQTVRMRARATADQIELTFEDDGEPFNLLNQPAPKAATSIEDATLGGLGIPLVVRLSASVRYEQPAAAPDASGFHPRNRVIVTLASR